MQEVAGSGRDNLSRCEDKLVAMSVTCVYVSIISHSISFGDTPSVTFATLHLLPLLPQNLKQVHADKYIRTFLCIY